MRGVALMVTVWGGIAAFMAAVSLAQAGAASVPTLGVATDLSAQERVMRRRPTRIEVYPLPGPLRRECVAVFEERWIPQWGGWVLRPGQQCWWTRAPL